MKTERESNFQKWLRADTVEKTERACPECGGTGISDEQAKPIPGIGTPVMDCPTCNGTGIKEREAGE